MHYRVSLDLWLWLGVALNLALMLAATLRPVSAG